jgi:1-deoxy-D-xylulose-5-phosphate reductoisomerase
MRVPIASALAWPQRMETPCKPLDLASIGKLEFEAPDPIRFPSLRLARDAVAAGGAAPAVLNAANEVAVAAFLDRRIGFLEIATIVEEVLARSQAEEPEAIDHIWAIDAAARQDARAVAEEMTV